MMWPLLAAWACAAPPPALTMTAEAATPALATGGDEPFALIDDTPAKPPARVEFTGSWHERLTSDLGWDAAELPFEALTELNLGAQIMPTPALEVRLAARLRHRLLTDRRAAVTGIVTPDLREAALVWRLGETSVVTAGYARPSWLRLVDPLPLDLTRGPFMDGRDQRAVPSLEVTHAFGPVTLGALWIPFRVATHLPLGPANWAPAVPGGYPEGTPTDLADLSDSRARTPQDGLTSGEVGLTARARTAAIDLTAAWLWRWDPLAAARPLTADGRNGSTRQHVLGLGAAFPTGPVRWKTEVAATLDDTAWTPTLSVERRPFLRWQLEVGWTPALPLDLTLEVHGTHALGAHADRFLGAGPNDVWVGGRMLLMLAFDGILRLDARGGADVLRRSWDLQAELALRALPDWELGLGLGVADGSRAEGGLGALFADRDRVWLRSTWQL